MTDLNTISGLDRTETKLLAFSRLQRGWKGGRGRPLGTRAHRWARLVSSYAAWFGIKSDVFMGIEGDVTVALYHENHDYAFHISEDGNITLASEMQDMEERAGLSLADCYSTITLIASSKWKLSYTYTWLTSTPRWSDFVARPSNPLVTAAAFPSSPWIVLMGQAGRSANTESNTIPRLPQSRPSFGFSTLTTSPPVIR